MELTIRNSSGDIQGSALLGEIFIEDGVIYKIVKNAESSTAMAAGDVVVYNVPSTTDVVLSSSAAQVCPAGVVADTIAAGEYGRIVVYGYVTGVKVDGGTTDVGQNAVIGTGTPAGYAYTTTAIGTVLGICLDTVSDKTTTGTKVFVKTLGA